MIFHRVFVGILGADEDAEGGALHAPWRSQRGGRHDVPNLFPAYYASESRVGAAAEALQRFRNVVLRSEDLERAGDRRLTLATVESSSLELVDLDHPRTLTHLAELPSQIATGNRSITQDFARRMYEEGANGLRWWSTLEASWINVTFFMDRCRRALRTLDVAPVRLDDPDVATACDLLSIERV